MSRRKSGWKKLLSGILCLCVLLSLWAGTPVTAQTEQEDLFRSYPSNSCFDSLWVGDIVVFPEQGEYDAYNGQDLAPGNGYTVLSGNGVEILDVEWGPGKYYKSLKFTQPGTAEVLVSVADPDTGASAEKTFSFTVSPRQEEVTVTHNFPASITMKIGDDTAELSNYNVSMQNLNYGLVPWGVTEELSGGIDISGTAKTIIVGGKGGDIWKFVNDQRTEENAGCLDFEYTFGSFGVYYYACRPGTLTLQPVYRSQKIGDPICTITVEDPEITTNAPAAVWAGDTLSLETALTNTALTNLKVSEYTENIAENGFYWGEENIVAYQPSVTILEGQDCVAQSDQDYTNTLTTSETLAFQKPGTVKLKVTYAQIDVEDDYNQEYFDERAYNPETILTIRVQDPSQDLDGDGAISVGDVMTLAQAVVNASTTPTMDFNADGLVDVLDVMTLARVVVDQ